MTELSPAARELLARGRAAHDPTPADFARAHAAFTSARVALDAAAASPAVDTQSALAVGKSSAGGALGLSKVVGLCTLALAGGLIFHVASGPRSPSTSARSTPAPATPPLSAQEGAVSDAGSEAVPSPAPDYARAEAAARVPAHELAVASNEHVAVPRALPSRVPSRRAPPSAASRATHAAPPEHVEVDAPEPAQESVAARPEARANAEAARGVGGDELALLHRAVNELDAGHADQALRLIETHRTRYPASVLEQERRGVRVLSLCALGDFERGIREQRAFLASESGSPLARRVRTACAPGQLMKGAPRP